MSRDYCKIAKEIAIKGFFSEYLPPCFSLSEKVLNYVPTKKCDLIAPYSFSMSRYNENDARRTIFIPEIGSYIAAYSYMNNNSIFQELIEFTESNNHSFSPILWSDDSIVRHEQAYGNDISGNSTLRFDYINNVGKKIIYASGAKKVIKLDISNCFSSFYMHMIPAILLGAEDAEKEYNKFSRNNNDEPINPLYEKYKELDKVIRRQNLNRTNGLLTGTLFSKIIAEAILTRIDKELEQKSLKFVRYVDDYEVFLYENNEQEIISIFDEVLKKYGFALNSEKTEIMDFPYYIVKNFEKILNSILEKPMERSNIIEVFNAFFEMEKNGTKGAIRYLLKSFEQNPPKIADLELYKAYLITIMANNERSLVKSCSILIENNNDNKSPNNKLSLTKDDINNISILLKNHILYRHDLEVIWILYLLIETQNICKGDSVVKDIVATNNELAHVMLLVKDLLDKDNLLNIKIKAKSWILLYELFANNVILEDEFIQKLNLNKNFNMYQELKANDIHFVSFKK